MNIIKKIESEHLRTDIPQFRSGDTVKFTSELSKAKKNVSRYFRETLSVLNAAQPMHLSPFAKFPTVLA